MDERNWDVVIRNNSLLSGITISPILLASTGDTTDTKDNYGIQINNAFYPGESKPCRLT